VLDHFHVEDDIETLARGCQVLGGGTAVIDGEFLFFRMDPGGQDVFFGRVDAEDGCSKPCHGFGQEPAAAADVEEAQAPEGLGIIGIAAKSGANLFLDKSQPDRVKDMENAEFTLGIPPFGSHFGEFLDFGGIKGGLGCGSHFKHPFLWGPLLHKQGPSSMSTPRRT